MMKLAVLLSFSLACALANAQTTDVSDHGGKAVAIVSNENDPSELALDRENIYWVSDHGTAIKKLSKAGGVPVTVATGKTIGQIVVDEENIFFTVIGEIRRVSKNGGTPTVLVKSDLIGYQRIQWVLDKTNLYYFDEVSVPPGTVDRNPLLRRVNKAGGVSVTLSSTTYRPVGLATDGVNIYWGDEFHDIVKKVSVNGGKTVFLGHCFHPVDVVVDESSVYCISRSVEVVKFKRAGQALNTRPSEQSSLYLVTTGKGGHGIYRLSKQGGPLQLVVALDRMMLSRFATDATGVYWVEPSKGKLMRVVP